MNYQLFMHHTLSLASLCVMVAKHASISPILPQQAVTGEKVHSFIRDAREILDTIEHENGVDLK